MVPQGSGSAVCSGLDEGRGGASLGTSGERETPPPPSERHKRQVGRGERHKLKAAQRRVSLSKSSRQCFYAMGADVQVDVGPEFIAHVQGVARCGSPHSCPVCAPVVRQRRALEIDEGLTRWLEGGHGAAFVTLTTRHHRGDELKGRLVAVSSALQSCLSGAPWKRRAERLGYRGAIRAVEVTYGRNGWHPHCHAILLFDRPVGAAELGDLEAWLFGRWSGVVERKGFGTLSATHGVDVRTVGAAGLGEYVTMVEGGWGAGMELTRPDLKKGKSGHVPPVELLRRFVETGEVRWLRLWLEYESATFGTNAFVWSRGLRGVLGLGAEKTDEEVAKSEGVDVEVLLRALIGSAQWSRHIKYGTTGVLLARIEEAAAAGQRTWSVDDQWSKTEKELVG